MATKIQQCPFKRELNLVLSRVISEDVNLRAYEERNCFECNGFYHKCKVHYMEIKPVR